MAKYKFDHIHVFTDDPEATAAWYEKMLGAEVIRSTQQGKPRIDLRLGGANIFVLDVSQDAKVGAAPAHRHHGLDHFGLEVEGIDAVCADLKAKGVKFTLEPTSIRPGIRIAFIAAPDDVSIELLERKPGI
jgi:catechol 2,3-dioxygenase-like lactoylglutathione lyase family enzyme